MLKKLEGAFDRFFGSFEELKELMKDFEKSLAALLPYTI